jgi:LacI family repressor for deo operon, udp, cdd, tsx, nupC, and nupG
MTTIVDVARLAQVSTATVSRTLSRPQSVNEAMRLRVQAAVAKLGYEPNPAARLLRTRRSFKILITVPDISNPFFSKVFRGAEEAARAADYSVIIGNTRSDSQIESRYAAMFQQHEVDGLLFLGYCLPSLLEEAVASTNNVVPAVHGSDRNPDLKVSSVHIDNVAAGADGMDHLVGLGHRRIGIISGPLDSPVCRDRLTGVQRIARAAGLPEPVVRSGTFSVETGFREAGQLLAEASVSAIFCFSDELAIGVLHAVYSAGLTCPNDISVVGCDDIDLSPYLEPPLTTISAPCDQIGRRAIRMLIDIIEQRQTSVESITLPHRLAIRHSSAPPHERFAS